MFNQWVYGLVKHKISYNKGEIPFFFNLHLGISFYCFLERGEREGGRETLMWKKHLSLPSTRSLTRNRTHNRGTCLDQEPNPQCFGEEDDTPTSWATQPGKGGFFYDRFQFIQKVFEHLKKRIWTHSRLIKWILFFKIAGQWLIIPKAWLDQKTNL